MNGSDSNLRKPQFNVGEPVIVFGPGVHRGKTGFVMEVIKPTTGDLIFRYRVRFADRTSATFFGFELRVKDA